MAVPSNPHPTNAAMAPAAVASAHAPAASSPVRKSTMISVRWIMTTGKRFWDERVLLAEFLRFLIFQFQKAVLHRQLVQIAAGQIFAHSGDFRVDDVKSL